jgi:hypothetical protein
MPGPEDVPRSPAPRLHQLRRKGRRKKLRLPGAPDVQRLLRRPLPAQEGRPRRLVSSQRVRKSSNLSKQTSVLLVEEIGYQPCNVTNHNIAQLLNYVFLGLRRQLRCQAKGKNILTRDLVKMDTYLSTVVLSRRT